MSNKQAIKQEILRLTKKYYQEEQAEQEVYQNGQRVNYGGRIFDEDELLHLVDASLDFWLTAGKYTKQFEAEFANYLNVKYCSLVNSGSSANLLAFMALTSYKLGEKRIKKGDEIITVAAAFPTTVAPILQYGAVPVFVDITIPQGNIDVTQLEEAYSLKTKAVMLAHTLGNPFDLQAIQSFCETHDLWLIEDNCDALGSEYFLNGTWKKTGTIGHIGTSSFYPPHHMTMGEGGAVYTNDLKLYHIVNSLRDWGRDCWCPPGEDGTCKRRYEQQFGELPLGYDHKYVYSHLGYNLKATDMQAAIGCAQLKKLEKFTKVRRDNWHTLRSFLEETSGVLILPEPGDKTNPSWFGFLLTVRDEAHFSRDDLVAYLEKKNIQTRYLFAGNILKHPCFDEFRNDSSVYRTVGTLKYTDQVMNQSFWIGVYPGMTKEKLSYMAEEIKEFVGRYKG